MDIDLTQEAIQEAVNGNWERAKKINENILKKSPNDINTLNRLARAFAELGEIEKAQKYSQKVLKIDPKNSIAINCIKKWKSFKKGVINTKKKVTNGRIFLEIPGKTKIIKLVNLGDIKTLAKLDCGDEVVMVFHPHSVSVTTPDSKYIGRLPDDLAIKFIKQAKDGFSYEAFLKSAQIDSITIFVKEQIVSPNTI